MILIIKRETLDNPLHNEHSIFTDYAELSLVSDVSLSEFYIKCTKCTSAFENEYDLQCHTETIFFRNFWPKRKLVGTQC